MIKILDTIHQVISCQFPINIIKFKEYCADTATLPVTLYPWYNLPASVHKILFHGAEIVESAALPIKSLSEEAQECRNKDYRFFGSHTSRNFSRQATNEDVFPSIMVSSDPLITSLRPKFTKKDHFARRRCFRTCFVILVRESNH